jgi:hypothetical protein
VARISWNQRGPKERWWYSAVWQLVAVLVEFVGIWVAVVVDRSFVVAVVIFVVVVEPSGPSLEDSRASLVALAELAVESYLVRLGTAAALAAETECIERVGIQSAAEAAGTEVVVAYGLVGIRFGSVAYRKGSLLELG